MNYFKLYFIFIILVISAGVFAASKCTEEIKADADLCIFDLGFFGKKADKVKFSDKCLIHSKCMLPLKDVCPDAYKNKIQQLQADLSKCTTSKASLADVESKKWTILMLPMFLLVIL